ncbi:hypothetical protein MSAR_24260 [Mycolicibacterium sarraceniae]|uniref:Uncharacterized protein n=1 Tax=Mycolicibacterium sarraceniae TaxID=1534348 RepID=A0A7I7SRT3_9MYCO|nr:hypothetical protein MSAR_24260 [Mycolicibacterium sarraceniae]
MPTSSGNRAYSRGYRDHRQAPYEGPHVADKSPRQSMTKKAGKSLKEKRADKRAKSDGNASDNLLNTKHR